MAYYIGGTLVFDNNAMTHWNNVSGKPDYVSGMNRIVYGDGYSIPSQATNVAFSGSTLTIWFTTNCNCVCVCDCGDGG